MGPVQAKVCFLPRNGDSSRIATDIGAPRKTSFASFSRCPAGLVYWGRGLTINGLRYR